MAQEIPLQPSVANYRFSTLLDGISYIFNIKWNNRESAWYMDLLTDDETPIREGVKLVLGTLLGGRSADANFPAGTFGMVDKSGAGLDATYDDIGVRVALWFTPDSDLGL